MATLIKKDIIIFGGGIAGLWLLNRLRSANYDAVLFEHGKLGEGQTIVSQGMIHGGIKYTLDGNLNSASHAIADMPAHWKACLQGKGDVDLRKSNILSESYYMLPKNNMRSRFNAFLGSKAVRGKVESLAREHWPDFFQGHIPGPLYQLNDIVLDVPSLLKNLYDNQAEHIYKIDWQHASLNLDANASIQNLCLRNQESPQNNIELQAQRYFFTSGAGTQALLKQATATSVDKNSISLNLPIFNMQLRPLQMVMVKHNISTPVYVHCVADQLTTTLDLTITSHQCADGSWIWYLGGALAEAGIDRSPEEQIAAAKLKLEALFPWCDLSQATWRTLFVDRAEAKQENGKRPEHASLIPFQNICVCWPTKLTLAPSLASAVLDELIRLKITPANYQNLSDLSHLAKPGIATTPWNDM